MSRTVACVLVLDGWAAAGATLASIRRLGLDIAVGLIGAESGERFDDIEVHEIEWREDFADARNQLAEKIEADWLLWLNDDEELIAFAEPDRDEPFAGVWVEHDADWTPRMAVRLQRRQGGARWSGALHEILITDGGGEVGLIDGITVKVTQDRTRARLDCLHEMSARGQGGYGFALAGARHAQASGPNAKTFMPWLRAYKAAAALPVAAGAPDPRVEPAIRLCAYDYRGPAIALLAENPTIVGFYYALLGADLRTEREFDKDRLRALVRHLKDESYDHRYSVIRGLIGVKPQLIANSIVASLVGDVDRDGSDLDQAGPQLVGRYSVAPLESRRGRFRIRLDAGLMFGTGGHPSTRGALLALDALAKRRRFRRIFDIGTGSGILAIAAAMTWPARVTALDTNSLSVAQTRRNFRANGLGMRARADTTFGLRAARLPRGAICDLGRDFSAGLYAREVDYLLAREWALTGEDILWRRSKLGLHCDTGTEAALDSWIAASSSARATAQ